MKSVVLTASISRNAGGLFTSVRRLHQTLSENLGVETEVLTLRDAYTEADLPRWSPLPIRAFPVIGPSSLGWSPGLRRGMKGCQADLVHSHGIWMYPSKAALDWHWRTRRPHVISPRGMLDPWSVKNSAWKKKIAYLLYERSHLNNAACLHALCPSEADGIRAFGLKNPIAVIPNGIDLPEQNVDCAPPWEAVWHNGEHVMLYLGRLHPKKGVLNLIQAWKLLKAEGHALLKDWRLAIYGWDQVGYAELLNRAIRELELSAEVRLFGPAYGEVKDAAFRHASAFVLPSYSEGLPMGVLEAWAYGLPVLMTRECNLPESFEADAAIQIFQDREQLARGLGEAVNLSLAARQEMGRRGMTLVRAKYTWQKVACEMSSVYQWLLGGGDTPGCVTE